jgi:hypothetical protein
MPRITVELRKPKRRSYQSEQEGGLWWVMLGL